MIGEDSLDNVYLDGIRKIETIIIRRFRRQGSAKLCKTDRGLPGAIDADLGIDKAEIIAYVENVYRTGSGDPLKVILRNIDAILYPWSLVGVEVLEGGLPETILGGVDIRLRREYIRNDKLVSNGDPKRRIIDGRKDKPSLVLVFKDRKGLC